MGRSWAAREGQATPIRPWPKPAWGLPLSTAPHTHTLSPQQAKFTYYRCAELLGWQLRHTLFCSLAWARGLSARHFLWACLVRGLGQGTPGCSWEGEAGAGPWPPQGPPPGPSV